MLLLFSHLFSAVYHIPCHLVGPSQGTAKNVSHISNSRSPTSDYVSPQVPKPYNIINISRFQLICLWTSRFTLDRIFCQVAVRKMGYSGADVARFLGINTSAVNRLAVSDELPEVMKYI